MPLAVDQCHCHRVLSSSVFFRETIDPTAISPRICPYSEREHANVHWDPHLYLELFHLLLCSDVSRNYQLYSARENLEPLRPRTLLP